MQEFATRVSPCPAFAMAAPEVMVISGLTEPFTEVFIGGSLFHPMLSHLGCRCSLGGDF